MWSTSHRQRGASTIVLVAALIGLGIVMLILLLLTTSNSGKKPGTDDTNKTANSDGTTTVSNESPYIRLPENSKIYKNSRYNFSFAYPDGFGELIAQENVSTGGSEGGLFRAQSALAAQKPVGDGTAFMNGRLATYVYAKEDFKIVVNSSDVSVAPTVTGDDITWKVVSVGNTTQGTSVGDSYTIKSVKSQTGVKVFDFTYRPGGGLALGRWIFAAGDNYVMISMPAVSRPSGENLSDNNFTAYDIIGSNIAKTIRVLQADTESADGSDEGSSD